MRYLTRFALIVASAALFAGCSGSQNIGGAVPQGLEPQGQRSEPRTDKDLLYVSNTAYNEVEVFSFPKGGRVERLRNINEPGPICTDASGNVFITSYNPGKIIEYAHGAKNPTATLTLPYPGYADDCAVDSTTRNLAVADGGLVAIYQTLSTSPVTITPQLGSVFDYVSYDASGNLFISGAVGRNGAIWEIPKGMSVALPVLFPQGDQNEILGPLHWDGQYISVLGSYDGINRISVAPGSLTRAGSFTGSIVSQTTFENCRQQWTFWIQGSTLIVSCASTEKDGQKRYAVGFWNYPAGGKMAQSIIKGAHPGGPYLGLAVSVR